MPDQDPGEVLRAKLETMPIDPLVNRNHLGEILYTACETGILDFDLLTEDAMLIARMIELAKVATDEDIADLRM